MPDLLVIDGGLGQVRRALAVLQELQVESVKTLGIAKGVERISGEERFFLAKRKSSSTGVQKRASVAAYSRRGASVCDNRASRPQE